MSAGLPAPRPPDLQAPKVRVNSPHSNRVKSRAIRRRAAGGRRRGQVALRSAGRPNPRRATGHAARGRSNSNDERPQRVEMRSLSKGNGSLALRGRSIHGSRRRRVRSFVLLPKANAISHFVAEHLRIETHSSTITCVNAVHPHSQTRPLAADLPAVGENQSRRKRR